MSETTILAVGPWDPDQVTSSWREDAWLPPPELERRADAAIAALLERGSPAHDGLAARLASWDASAAALSLELEPTRWALRLVDGESHSLTAMCVVRRDDGRWLAGRRAGWLATWPGRWTLGAAGSVGVGENPAHTLIRELEEEWQLVPSRLSISALVSLRSGVVALVGLARVPVEADPIADAEHDEFDWWPADAAASPADADERLRRMAALVDGL